MSDRFHGSRSVLVCTPTLHIKIHDRRYDSIAIMTPPRRLLCSCFLAEGPAARRGRRLSGIPYIGPERRPPASVNQQQCDNLLSSFSPVGACREQRSWRLRRVGVDATGAPAVWWRLATQLVYACRLPTALLGIRAWDTFDLLLNRERTNTLAFTFPIVSS